MNGDCNPDAERARLVVTEQERYAVYRLRYDVYLRELHKGFLPAVDHAKGLVKDPEDEQAGVSIFYTGSVCNPSGTLRIQVWEPGCVPAEVYQRFSLQQFPGIERFKVSEAARLVIKPDARGTQVLSSLACAAFEHTALRHDVFVCFLYCSPGLVRTYMALGFRPYAGALIPNEDGIRLPMVIVASDLEHLKQVGSPLAPLMAIYFDTASGLPDMNALLGVAQRHSPHYEVEPQRIWAELQSQLQPDPQSCSTLLRGLSDQALRTLCSDALIMDVPVHKVLMRAGLVEAELYLVLNGSYEICMEDRRIGLRGKGDVLGEVAFFQHPAERVATIRSLTSGRVMVLGRHFLTRIVHSEPELACRILFNLGRVMAGHLAQILADLDRQS